MPDLVIETERLVLRPLAADDLEELARIYADAEVMRYIGDGGAATRDETAAWIERHIALSDRQGYGLFATVERQPGSLIGRCGLVHWEIDQQSELEVGWLIARDRWGRGYATEAGRAWRDFALAELGRRRLISLIQHGNVASARVARKLGAVYERDVELGGKPVSLFSVSR